MTGRIILSGALSVIAVLFSHLARYTPLWEAAKVRAGVILYGKPKEGKMGTSWPVASTIYVTPHVLECWRRRLRSPW